MIYITQLIFLKEGKEATFIAFENLVIPLMKEHKGKMLYRVRPDKESFITAEKELPYEIHFIAFESDHYLTNYLNDKRRLDFIDLKNESISSTITVKGGLL